MIISKLKNKFIRHCIKKSYTSGAWANFTNILLKYSDSSIENLVNFLSLNLTHYNIFEPKLFNKCLNKYKKDQDAFNILYDNAIRLYLTGQKTSYIKHLLNLKTDEILPNDFYNCKDTDLNNDIEILKNVFNKNLQNDSFNAICLNNNKTINLDNKGENIVVLVHFASIILNENSTFSNDDKINLSKFYSSIINLSHKFDNIYILPVFTNRWIVDYKCTIPVDFCFTHHSKLNNKNQIVFKKSYLPGYYYLNNQGFSGWYQSSFNTAHQNVSHNIYDSVYKEFVTENKSKYKQSNENYIPAPRKKVIFVATQTINDVVAQLAYLNTFTLLKTVVKLYKNKNDIEIVVKRHPFCNDRKIEKYISKIRKYKNVTVSNANIQSIIKHSDVVCVCNSGVGFESLLQLKPVIVTGKCDYSIVCNVAKNKKELQKALCNILKNNTANKTIIKNFLEHYLQFDNIKSENIELKLAKLILPQA